MRCYVERSVIRAPVLAGKVRLLEDTPLRLLVSQSALVRGNSTRYIRTKLRLSFLRGVRSSSGLAVAMLFARWRARGAPDDD